jgi:hypothetical protein
VRKTGQKFQLKEFHLLSFPHRSTMGAIAIKGNITLLFTNFCAQVSLWMTINHEYALNYWMCSIACLLGSSEDDQELISKEWALLLVDVRQSR